MAAKKPTTPAPSPRPAEETREEPRAEKPGERRAIRLITLVEAAQEDPDKAIDTRHVLGALPALSQRYLVMLLREGPRGNAEAAKALKVSESDLERAVVALEEAVRDIADDEA